MKEGGLMALFEAAERLEESLPDGIRKETLRSARNLRADWVVLAGNLWNIAHGGDYHEWGFAQMEDYARKELGMKRPALTRLISAYEYTKKHHPEVLERGRLLPEVATVAALQKVSEKEGAREVDAKIYSGELQGAEAREAIRSLSAGESMESTEKRRRARIRKLCQSLRAELAICQEVPFEVAEKIEKNITEMVGYLND